MNIKRIKKRLLRLLVDECKKLLSSLIPYKNESMPIVCVFVPQNGKLVVTLSALRLRSA